MTVFPIPPAPHAGVAYSNAILQAGYAINTENSDTNYRSGSLLHFDGAVQQIRPAGSGFVTLGAEGFYFQQVTCDSGSGAVLGCFKGRPAGLQCSATSSRAASNRSPLN